MRQRTSPGDALRVVQELLRDWARWKRRWRPKLGYPNAVPYLDSVRGTVDGYAEDEDYDQRVDAIAMRHLDHAIEHDLTSAQRIAVSVAYLNEVGPAVWRSGRISKEQAAALRADAETILVASLRKRCVLT